jgi:chaperonin GroES
MELSKGDRVIYSKFAGTEYKDGDEEYLILRESDILAKIGAGKPQAKKAARKK